MKMLWALVLVLASATAEAAETSAGSGVVIGAQGEILTNSHVVEDCQQITVQFPSKGSEVASLVARDQRNDLAVIRTGKPTASVAVFRDGAPIRAGDAIVALGYPLSGLLASTANLSVGNVSALAGLGDDSRYLQISAPVQPGNSGGPLLDASGHLIGIVTAKLDAMRVAKFTGDIPQNVNFALKAEVARTFLDSKGVAYQKASSDQQVSPSDVGDIARPFTIHIRCEQTRSPPTVASVAPAEHSKPPSSENPLPPPNSPSLPVGSADELFKKGEAALATNNFTDAMHWFRQAANKGHVGATARIGFLYFKERNYRAAMVWSLEAAEKGSTYAMNNVGVMYHEGQGVLGDLNEAARWLRRAAEKGDAIAMNNIAVLYHRGEGVDANEVEAFRWYRQAADAGHTGAMRNIGARYAKGQVVRQDYGEAMRWYRRAADRGDPDAMNDIALMYLRGEGRAKDFNEAMRWFRQSAEKGNVFAMSDIGQLYARGIVVPKDCETARRWMQKAAASKYVSREGYEFTETKSEVLKLQEGIKQLLRSGVSGCQW
jgi:TPR repeat protein